MPCLPLLALLAFGLVLYPAHALEKRETLVLESEFRETRYGRIPEGWQVLAEKRPCRNWAVDGKGFLRSLLKLHTGLICYAGKTVNGSEADRLGDVKIAADFKKTEDEMVAFGVAARVVDERNFYLARFRGTDRLELLKVKDGEERPLDFVKPLADIPTRSTGVVALQRYREGEIWTLRFTTKGSHLTAVVLDGQGQEQARLDATDTEFSQGSAGLFCTSYAASSSFRIDALNPGAPNPTPAPNGSRNVQISAGVPDYPVVLPHWKTGEIDTSPGNMAPEYDVVVAGAGTGGWASAIQAARMGARVLLLEETDWIGGQMAAAGVTTMDEGGFWAKIPARERGLYREFHESMSLYYQTLEKDPFVAYYGYPHQIEGGYEPKAARAVLYGFIKEARQRGARLDLRLRSRVVAVKKTGETVTGASVECVSDTDVERKEIGCKVLIDATEYGDVIPLTGARYRVGNGTNEKMDPKALVQDHTWTAIVREYPGGVPEHLKITTPPPGYEQGAALRYSNYQNHGWTIWGGAGKGIKGPRTWRTYFAWRGMADADGPLTGLRSSERHTQCGFNGGNDYPVTAATIEDAGQRLRDEREGIYRTLGALYYFQQVLGVNWSLAEDEGYATAYNRSKMRGLGLREDLEALAIHLPQQSYVREARRIIGVSTLVAADLTRFEKAKHVSTSVAMGDYFMDLDHGDTAHAVEPDLDSGEKPKGGGPFQVPFEVFLPEKVDGFLPAEKNISQSRLANGATRLQPITMLTGQAAGTIAALAVKHGVSPRQLSALQVQQVLLDSGCTLIQRWYADVAWGTPLWRATQLLSLHRVMDRPGDIDRSVQVSLGGKARWGVHEPLRSAELRAAVIRLVEINGVSAPVPEPPEGEVSESALKALFQSVFPAGSRFLNEFHPGDPNRVTAGEFALVAAQILLN